MPIRALTWNLFHGRDFPPDARLLTWRSRLLRITERSDTHAQVNRELFDEFATVIGAAPWDVALLQEVPPRWAGALAERCAAAHHLALTSRNSLAPVRALAARINPDLIASNEGGSNLTLVRGAEIADRREVVLSAGPRPERRVMAFTRLVGGPCIANLHASAGRANRARAEDELCLAAARALEWADGEPVILGGDLNVRPRDSSVYEELDERFGLAAATDPDSLDHLLAAGLDVAEPAAPWPAERREIASDAGTLRLSDHTPVEVVFEERPSG